MSVPQQESEQSVEQEPRRPEAATPGRQTAPQQDGGTQQQAAGKDEKKPRKSGDQARKDEVTEKLTSERFAAQSQRVRPGGYGANYDKAGLRPSDKKVAETPEAATPAITAPQITEIVKSIESLQMQLMEHQRTRSTDLETPEVISQARAKVRRLRSRLDEVEAGGTDKQTIMKVKFRLDEAAQVVDAAENAHHRDVAQVEADRKKSESEAGSSDGEADAAAKKPSLASQAKKHLADNADVKGSLIKREVTVSGALFGDDKAEESAGPLGATRIAKQSALSGDAKASAEVTMGKDGLQAEAGAEAKASLVDVQERWEWSIPIDALGQAAEATLYLFAKGSVSAEAKAKLSANVKALSPKSPKLDENEITAGVGVFAGAKLQLGVGAAYEWKKKDLKSYSGQLQKSAEAIIDLLSAVNPALGWLLEQLGGDAAAEQMLEWLFSWGATGKVPLVGIEAMGEGSAGIGASAMARAGIRGGKLDFMAKANATWGIGIGGMVKVMLDVVEGPKYAILCLGELLPMAMKFAREQMDKAMANGLAGLEAIWDWLGADDKAREAVANGAHRVLGASERGRMIETMMGGWCGNDDEEAIIKILEFSKDNGDLWTAVEAAGGSDDILWALDGVNDTTARRLLGVA